MEHTEQHKPLISIVVPAYNEEKLISHTIKSLQKQTYPNVEIIIVDNNSTDNTAHVARELGVKVVVEKQKGVGAARQRGFSEAKGEIIACTDADTLVPHDWLEKTYHEFVTHPSYVAVGGVSHLNSGPWTAQVASKYLYYPFVMFDKIVSGGWNMSGFSMAIKKDAFLKAGGFRTEMVIGEDVDLSQRLRKIGEVVVKPNIVVYGSGRRFNKGLLRGVWDYAPSAFMRMAFKKEKFQKFTDVRE